MCLHWPHLLSSVESRFSTISNQNLGKINCASLITPILKFNFVWLRWPPLICALLESRGAGRILSRRNHLWPLPNIGAFVPDKPQSTPTISLFVYLCLLLCFQLSSWRDNDKITIVRQHIYNHDTYNYFNLCVWHRAPGRKCKGKLFSTDNTLATSLQW